MRKDDCTRCGMKNLDNARYCSGCGFELPKLDTEPAVDFSAGIAAAKKLKRNKLIGTIVGALVTIIVAILVQQMFFKEPLFDKMLMKVASELNASAPIMVDQYTRFDNAVALPDKTFQYNYTLVTSLKTEVNVDTLKKYIEPVILNIIKTSPDMKILRDYETTYSYIYKDKNGEFIYRYVVTPQMYK